MMAKHEELAIDKRHQLFGGRFSTGGAPQRQHQFKPPYHDGMLRGAGWHGARNTRYAPSVLLTRSCIVGNSLPDLLLLSGEISLKPQREAVLVHGNPRDRRVAANQHGTVV